VVLFKVTRFTVIRAFKTRHVGRNEAAFLLRFAGRVAGQAVVRVAGQVATWPGQIREWRERRQAKARLRAILREQAAHREAVTKDWFVTQSDELTHPDVTPERLRTVAEEALRRAYDNPGLSLTPLRGAPWLPSPSPEVLSLYRQIAAHSNTPPELLLLLVGFPGIGDALLRNPVLPLLPLENLDFFAQLPSEARWRLLSSPDCPPSVVGMFAASPDALTADAARNHISRAPVSDGPIRDQEAELRKRLCHWVSEESPRVRALVVELHALGVLPEPFWDIAAAARGGIDNEHDPLNDVPVDEAARQRCEEASDRATHLWTLRMLAGDPHPAVRRAACAHPLAPIAVREHARAAALREAMRSSALALLLHLAESDTAPPVPLDFPPVESLGGLPPLRRLLYARQANPLEHRTLLQSLSRDGDCHVRAAARRFHGLGILD
jgi:hypothetical protein